MNKPILLLTLSFALAPLAGYAEEKHEHHHPAAQSQDLNRSRPEPLSGQSIYHLDSAWTDQEGKATKISALRGLPVVVAMVYTSCPGACPMTIADLKRIEEGIPEAQRSQVRFAVFSFDSKRDTPAKLKAFVKSRSLDPGRWTLFHGTPGSVRKLAAILGIRYKMDKAGEFDHSNVITLLDRAGLIAHQQVGLRQDPKETVSRLTRLLGAPAK
jgi:protein SCO1/2